MYFASWPSSLKALRSEKTWWDRFASSTTASGHTRLSRSSLVRTRPPLSTSASSTSKVFGGSRTGVPDRSNTRWDGSTRKGPNSYRLLEMRSMDATKIRSEIVHHELKFRKGHQRHCRIHFRSAMGRDPPLVLQIIARSG